MGFLTEIVGAIRHRDRHGFHGIGVRLNHRGHFAPGADVFIVELPDEAEGFFLTQEKEPDHNAQDDDGRDLGGDVFEQFIHKGQPMKARLILPRPPT
jgi:hypothetical protein